VLAGKVTVGFATGAVPIAFKVSVERLDMCLFILLDGGEDVLLA